MLSMHKALDLIPSATHKIITEITAPNLNLPSSALPIILGCSEGREHNTKREHLKKKKRENTCSLEGHSFPGQ